MIERISHCSDLKILLQFDKTKIPDMDKSFNNSMLGVSRDLIMVSPTMLDSRQFNGFSGSGSNGTGNGDRNGQDLDLQEQEIAAKLIQVGVQLSKRFL